MALVGATTRLDTLGTAVSMGFGIVCLLLRAWLTRPRRGAADDPRAMGHAPESRDRSDRR